MKKTITAFRVAVEVEVCQLLDAMLDAKAFDVVGLVRQQEEPIALELTPPCLVKQTQLHAKAQATDAARRTHIAGASELQN